MATETLQKSGQNEVSTNVNEQSSTWTYRPNVDIVETDNELLMHLDIPGANADSIDIDFRDGTLTVQAKVPARQEEKTAYLLREYGVGNFYRAFTLSESVDAANISAEYKQGVLKLHLPKVSAAKPHKISVKGD